MDAMVCCPNTFVLIVYMLDRIYECTLKVLVIATGYVKNLINIRKGLKTTTACAIYSCIMLNELLWKKTNSYFKSDVLDIITDRLKVSTMSHLFSRVQLKTEKN